MQPDDRPASAAFQSELDTLIDGVLELLERSAAAGVELDPLATILARLQARGAELDLAGLPPLVRMILEGAVA